MGRRREEKVDEEELARLMDNEEGESSKIRVKMPNSKVNEMFAIAEQILGGRRVTVLCADGETRMARIPGKMRRRQWVREGDLIIVWPWDFQDSKADVKHRYTKTQAMYLSRKGVLPSEVDVFGMNTTVDDFDDEEQAQGEGRRRPRGAQGPVHRGGGRAHRLSDDHGPVRLRAQRPDRRGGARRRCHLPRVRRRRGDQSVRLIGRV